MFVLKLTLPQDGADGGGDERIVTARFNLQERMEILPKENKRVKQRWLCLEGLICQKKKTQTMTVLTFAMLLFFTNLCNIFQKN
jgi:hypothetical protein